ncbi:MAG: ABC transporter permease [Dehalococcoidia bacterium]|nr:ABC transporter permease [Dehalococcoidia bacterium]
MSGLKRTVRKALASPSGMAGTLMLASLVTAAFIVAITGPDSAAQDIQNRLAGPGAGHLLGTDQLGRDVLARVGAAMRGSLWVAFAVAAISGAAGGLIGLASGYLGGWADVTSQRAVDALMAFPVIVLALGVVAATGPTKTGVVIALSVAFTPVVARVARASAISRRSAGYSEAARAMGAGPWAVVVRHVLPNALGPWVVVVSTQVGGALVAEASLSFLGVGAQGAGSLGSMLGREAQVYMSVSPWLAIWPGATLALTTLAANLIGDAVADASTTPPTR